MNAFQKRLMLALCLLVVLQAGFNFVDYFGEVRGKRFGGDFISFWRAAQHLGAGDFAGIYDPDGWRAVLESGRGATLSWFPYPPFALFGLWPLRHMSYDQAVFWWSVLPLPLYFLLIRLLVRRSFAQHPPGARQERQVTLTICALSLPFLSANIFSGQTGAWIGVAALAAAYFWRERPIVAGVCIGLIAIKPQLGVLLPFALAAGGRWHSFAAAAATVLLLIVASLLWLGADIWADYFAMTGLFGSLLLDGHKQIAGIELGPYVSMLGIGAPRAWAILVQAICSAGAIAAVLLLFRNRVPDGRDDIRFGILALGMVTATPYALSYDTPLLALVLMPLVCRMTQSGITLLPFAAMLWLVAGPFAMPSLIDWHLPIGFLSVLLCGWALASLYRAKPGVVAQEVRDSSLSAAKPVLG